MRNKIAWKLTLYFAAVLLIFALVVGGTFMHFFGKHTLDLKKKEMQVRATKIAEVLQDNMSRLQNRYGGIGSSRFIRYIDNITMENVWVVDENKNVKMHREDVGALPEQHGMMHGHKRMLMRQQEDIAEPASDFDYNALSPEIKRAVEQGFTGQNFVMEEINPVLGELVVTVGVPVSDAGGKVRAVVLLHSPVQGMREAAWEGIRILILSCVVAMVLVFVLSMLFRGSLPTRSIRCGWLLKRCRSMIIRSAAISTRRMRSGSWLKRWTDWAKDCWKQIRPVKSWSSCAVILSRIFPMSCGRR